MGRLFFRNWCEPMFNSWSPHVRWFSYLSPFISFPTLDYHMYISRSWLTPIKFPWSIASCSCLIVWAFAFRRCSYQALLAISGSGGGGGKKKKIAVVFGVVFPLRRMVELGNTRRRSCDLWYDNIFYSFSSRSSLLLLYYDYVSFSLLWKFNLA